MSDYLIGAKLELGETGKCGLKRADELGLELAVYLVAAIMLLDVAADIGVEENGIVNFIRIETLAADGAIDIKTYL